MHYTYALTQQFRRATVCAACSFKKRSRVGETIKETKAMNAETVPTPPETLRDWFIRRLAEIRLGRPTPVEQKYFPTEDSTESERLLGTASEGLKGLYALKEEIKHRGKRLDPALPDYENLLKENKRLFGIANEIYQVELERQFADVKPGQRLRVVRRFEVVVSPDPSEHKSAQARPGVEDALESVTAIIRHYGVVKQVLGPEITRIVESLRNRGGK